MPLSRKFWPGENCADEMEKSGKKSARLDDIGGFAYGTVFTKIPFA
jgi:hypothetical protein